MDKDLKQITAIGIAYFVVALLIAMVCLSHGASAKGARYAVNKSRAVPLIPSHCYVVGYRANMSELCPHGGVVVPLYRLPITRR